MAAIERKRQNQVRLGFDDAEAPRHHANDAAGLGIDDEIASDDRAIAPEMALPVSIVEHDGGGAPGETEGWRGALGSLIGRKEPAAGGGWNGEGLEHSVTDGNGANLLRLG